MERKPLVRIDGVDTQLPSGDALAGAWVPRSVATGQVFSVAENTQALFALPIMVDGDLMVSGDLVGVA